MIFQLKGDPELQIGSTSGEVGWRSNVHTTPTMGEIVSGAVIPQDACMVYITSPVAILVFCCVF